MRSLFLVLSLSCLASASQAAGPRQLGCNFDWNGPHTKLLKVQPVTPESLHRFVQKGNGYGGLRCPQFYKATAGARFYRLWDGRPTKAGEWGRSWTVTPFALHAAGYREKFAVCESWNDLSKGVICEIKPGAEATIAVGPGERVSRDQCGGHENYREVSDLQAMFVSDPNAVCKKPPPAR